MMIGVTVTERKGGEGGMEGRGRQPGKPKLIEFIFNSMYLTPLQQLSP